jgi:GNAT superfamily N-acetyltransferase
MAHHALEQVWELLYRELDGALLERRSDLIFVLYPPIPIPQVNGAWVVEDTQAAADGLADAVAEVDAAGAWPWIQTRSAHERTRQAAFDLGLTHTELVPGMVMRPGELVEPDIEIEIALTSDDDLDATNEALAVSFEAPKELFEMFNDTLRRVEGVSVYSGRVDGTVVSTAVGVTVDGVTGVFDVATPPEHRGRGYGAALTAHVVRTAFETGSELAFLQSSEIGHSVYRRLGFRDVEEYILCTRPFPA